MALVVDVVRRLGSFALQARFASEGKLTAFFGPSGSGKTSLLNIIAGIVRPDKGSIVLNGRTLVDTGQGIFVPKHRRRFGYVFQEARLFPHLTVRQISCTGNGSRRAKSGPSASNKCSISSISGTFWSDVPARFRAEKNSG